MKQTKLMIITQALRYGGAEELILLTCKHLDRERYDVQVCQLQYAMELGEGVLAQEIEALGVKVTTLNLGRKFNPLALLQLVRLLRRERIDVVHTHLIQANTYGRLAALLARRPAIVATEHSAYPWRERRWTPRNILDRWLARRSDKIIAVSEQVASHYLRWTGLPSARVAVIPNAVDLGKFNSRLNGRDKASLRASLGLPAQSPVVGTVGNLYPPKGHEYLLRAVPDILGQHPGCRFLLVGGGSLRPPLEEEARRLGVSDNVTFAGLRRDVPEMLDLMDVFVLPSVREGLPITLLEAMAMSKPIVATAVGGVPEVIEDGKSGLLVEPRDSEALARALSALLESPEQRLSLGLQARERVEKVFSAQRFADQTQATYEALLTKPPGLRRPVKIAHVSTVDITMRFLLLNQLRFLRDRGYEALGMCADGPWLADVRAAGLPVDTVEMKRRISPLADLMAVLKMAALFRRERVDLVHTHTPKAGLLGQIAAKLAGVRRIVNTIHGFYFHEHMRPLPRRFYVLMEKTAALCTDLAFFQSREDIRTARVEHILTRAELRHLGNGIDLERFRPEAVPASEVAARRAELQIAADETVVGIVGRLTDEKGFPEFFEAARQVSLSRPRTKFLVVGPSDVREETEYHVLVARLGIPDKVIFAGMQLDMPLWYALMDVFALPSHREGFPRSVMEACAMSRPVVATNIRGCREAVTDGVTGILVPLKDARALAGAILKLLNDGDLRARMGAAGRRRAEELFDERMVFEKVAAGYRALAQRKSPAR